jgi:hypothetical protein
MQYGGYGGHWAKKRRKKGYFKHYLEYVRMPALDHSWSACVENCATVQHGCPHRKRKREAASHP